MMRKLFSTTAVAVLALVAFVPTASAAKPAKTTLTIDAAFLGNGQSFWSGGIASAKKACAEKRAVTVFLVRPGADKKIGTTKSYAHATATGAPGYFWDYASRLAAPKGKYYAVVKPTAKCKGDTSNKISRS